MVIRNKKGAVAFDWIFGLVFLFSLGLLFVVFNHILVDEFIPVIEGIIPDGAPAQNDVILANTEWMSYWNILPYFFLIVILVFWLVSALRKEPVV